ncbi:hypothetical protein V6N12_055192, partial [Hibiscus sabdariffa]
MLPGLVPLSNFRSNCLVKLAEQETLQ